MFDLDEFKAINDRHGHPVGDKMLRHFADTLRGVVRSHDLFGRLGGEEFALAMSGIARGAAAVIAERCRVAVEKGKLLSDAAEIQTTASAGVAAYDADGGDVDTLIKAADAALYRAKAAGRNRVVACSREGESARG